MKAATLAQIKKELGTVSPQKLMALTLKLIKYKVENKELISYLLFDEDDQASYISDIKSEVTDLLSEIGHMTPYISKRTMRKTLKAIAKYVKYTGSKEVEAELYVHFCKIIKEQKINKYTHKAVLTIYLNTVEKIRKSLPNVHEELRHDYELEIVTLLKY